MDGISQNWFVTTRYFDHYQLKNIPSRWFMVCFTSSSRYYIRGCFHGDQKIDPRKRKYFFMKRKVQCDFGIFE